MPLDPIAYAPYADPDAFIREVTDRIWVGRDIGHIAANYEDDSIVHGPLGTAIGVDQVVQGSMMRIAETPSHIGQAEDFIWEVRGDDSFLSSHLVFSSDPVPTASGIVNVRSRTIANCLYRRGRMVEEWVVRDSLAHALQLGEDPGELARAQRFAGYLPSWTDAAPSDVLAVGDSGPRPDEFRSECEVVLRLVEEVWNGRNLNLVNELFERDLFLHTIGDATYVRPDGYQRELLNLIKPFPACRFEVRDVQAQRTERYGGVRVAIVWRMLGAYEGIASYGPLTGAQVDLLGISQFQFHEGRIVKEIRLFDEIGLRAQINAGRGDGDFAFANLY